MTKIDAVEGTEKARQINGIRLMMGKAYATLDNFEQEIGYLHLQAPRRKTVISPIAE